MAASGKDRCQRKIHLLRRLAHYQADLNVRTGADAAKWITDAPAGSHEVVNTLLTLRADPLVHAPSPFRAHPPGQRHSP
eukprot:2551054-Alexandrium_andersonii.AAC.1